MTVYIPQLRDESQEPIYGVYDIKVTLYNDSMSALWTDTYPEQKFRKGFADPIVLNVENFPLLSGLENPQLGFVIEGMDLAESFIPITLVPYSLSSQVSDTIDWENASGDMPDGYITERMLEEALLVDIKAPDNDIETLSANITGARKFEVINTNSNNGSSTIINLKMDSNRLSTSYQAVKDDVGQLMASIGTNSDHDFYIFQNGEEKLLVSSDEVSVSSDLRISGVMSGDGSGINNIQADQIVGTLATDNIAEGTITNEMIAEDASIAYTKLDIESEIQAFIDDSDLDAGHLTMGTLSSDRIAEQSITNEHLVTVDVSKIVGMEREKAVQETVDSGIVEHSLTNLTNTNESGSRYGLIADQGKIEAEFKVFKDTKGDSAAYIGTQSDHDVHILRHDEKQLSVIEEGVSITGDLAVSGVVSGNGAYLTDIQTSALTGELPVDIVPRQFITDDYFSEDLVIDSSWVDFDSLVSISDAHISSEAAISLQKLGKSNWDNWGSTTEAFQVGEMMGLYTDSYQSGLLFNLYYDGTGYKHRYGQNQYAGGILFDSQNGGLSLSVTGQTNDNEDDVEDFNTVLFLDASSFVGIGNRNPKDRLHLSGGNLLIDPGYGFHIGQDDSMFKIEYLSDTEPRIAFKNNENEYMSILENGKVGFNTITPSGNLEVSDYLNTTLRLISTKNDADHVQGEVLGSLLFVSQDDSGGGAGDRAGIQAINEDNLGGGTSLAFYTSSVTQNMNEAVWISHAGKVGVGTDEPSSKLDVVGDVQATSFIGDGATITGLNGSNITLGIIDNDRLNKSSTSNSGIVKLSNDYQGNSQNVAVTEKALSDAVIYMSDSNMQSIDSLGSMSEQDSVDVMITGGQLTNIEHIDSDFVDTDGLDVNNDANIDGDLVVDGDISAGTLGGNGFGITNLNGAHVTGTIPIGVVQTASTSQTGTVQLSNLYSGTSETKAVTEKALSDAMGTLGTLANQDSSSVSLTGNLDMNDKNINNVNIMEVDEVQYKTLTYSGGNSDTVLEFEQAITAPNPKISIKRTTDVTYGWNTGDNIQYPSFETTNFEVNNFGGDKSLITIPVSGYYWIVFDYDFGVEHYAKATLYLTKNGATLTSQTLDDAYSNNGNDRGTGNLTDFIYFEEGDKLQVKLDVDAQSESAVNKSYIYDMYLRLIYQV